MQERLQKIIARAGIASRRHAELLIASGQVRVNGRVVKELGTKADATKDRIEAAGRVVEAKEGRRVYILLNKPPEVVSAMADPEGRKTLRNCLRGLPERVFPVGNLEYAALRRVLFKEKHPLEKLKRIGLGPLSVEGIPRGRYRMIEQKEAETLGKLEKSGEGKEREKNLTQRAQRTQRTRRRGEKADSSLRSE